MKRYIIKVGFFFLGLLLIITLCIILPAYNSVLNDVEAFITNSEDYVRNEEAAKAEAILATMDADNGYSKLLVGDSVSYFLFNRLQEYNQEYLLAGTSRPFTIAGQYVQIKEFLENHDNATDVYMFESKATWEAVVDPQGTYQNLVVPTIETGTFDNLNTTTQEEIKKTFSTVLLNKKVVHLYNYSNMNRKIVLNGVLLYHEKILGEDVSAPYESTPNEVSPLAQYYLKSIIELCEDHNVELHILHDPLADTAEKRAEVEQERVMFAQCGYTESTLFEKYYNSVLYYPESYFFDGVHFNIDDELQNAVIKDMQTHTQELGDLKYGE